MPAVYKTARFAIRSDSLDRCRRTIEEFVFAVKENEPGTRLHAALQEADDATRFLHVSVFDDGDDVN